MLIKLIYEDEQLDEIKDKIKALETKQLYFVEEFVRREKKNRKIKVFQEWKETLDEILENRKDHQGNKA